MLEPCFHVSSHSQVLSCVVKTLNGVYRAVVFIQGLHKRLLCEDSPLISSKSPLTFYLLLCLVCDESLAQLFLEYAVRGRCVLLEEQMWFLFRKWKLHNSS